MRWLRDDDNRERLRAWVGRQAQRPLVRPVVRVLAPGYALVRDDREIKIKQGRGQLSFTDVAALIDPTTVTFTSLSDPATRVLEQNFQFDLVSTQKLLQKFIERVVAA